MYTEIESEVTKMKQLNRQQFDIVITSEEDKEVQILQYVIGTLNNFMARVRQTANTQEYNVPSLTLYDINTIIKECFPHIDVEFNEDATVINFTTDLTEIQSLIDKFILYIIPCKDEGIKILVDLSYRLDSCDDDDRVVCYQDLELTNIIELYTDVVTNQTNRLLKLYS